MRVAVSQAGYMPVPVCLTWSHRDFTLALPRSVLGRERSPNGVRAYPCRDTAASSLVFPGHPALVASTPLETQQPNRGGRSAT
jgi:hypothetical protein